MNARTHTRPAAVLPKQPRFKPPHLPAERQQVDYLVHLGCHLQHMGYVRAS